MCRNHSHIAVEITGTVIIGRNTLVEARMEHPLVVELPFGAKWTRPSGLHLLMPYSMRAGLPLSTPQAMGVCYIPSFYSPGSDMTIMQEMEQRRKNAGDIGETALYTMGSSPPWKDEELDDVPF